VKYLLILVTTLRRPLHVLKAALITFEVGLKVVSFTKVGATASEIAGSYTIELFYVESCSHYLSL
jgi:hypothetical protein